VVEISQHPARNSVVEAARFRKQHGLSRMFRRVRNRLDKPLPFTYHTQAFATGLTAVAAKLIHGNGSK
jgi:hypothetical protein